MSNKKVMYNRSVRVFYEGRFMTLGQMLELKSVESSAYANLDRFEYKPDAQQKREKTTLTGAESLAKLQKLHRVNQIFYRQTDKKAELLRSLLKHSDLFELGQEENTDSSKFL